MNIIINGGTRGIGKQVALLFAQNPDNKLIVTGRNEKSLKELSATWDNIHTIQLDISNFESETNHLMSFISSSFKSIDILVNMAGYLVSEDFAKFKNNDARRIMEVNFFGPAFFINSCLKHMAVGSHIVNISSMAGFQGSSKYPGLSYYSASKAALSSLSECLAGELKNAGISVNSLALGAVQTEMLQEAFPGLKAPLDARDMAEFICYFSEHGHKFFNGKTIPVAMSNP